MAADGFLPQLKQLSNSFGPVPVRCEPQHRQLPWSERHLSSDPSRIGADDLLQTNGREVCRHEEQGTQLWGESVRENLARPVDHDPTRAYRTGETIAHAEPEPQLVGPAIDADGLEHAQAFGPSEGRQAMPSHRDDGGIRLLAQFEVGVPPSVGN